MKKVKIKIHNLSDGKFQTCFLDPKTGKKKRNLFNSLKEAKEFQKDLEHRFQMRGIHALSQERIARLMALHIKKRPHTKVRERKNAFQSFIEKFGVYKISEITVSDLTSWLHEFKRKNDLSDRTMLQIKVQMNHFFRFLIEEGILNQNPIMGIKFKRNPPPRRKRVVLSVGELRELLENAKRFDEKFLYPFLYTAVHTGARREELLKLRREEVDFKTGMILLRETKNGEDRSVKMGEKLEAFLRKHLSNHSSENVFPNEFGKKMHRGQFQRLIIKFKHHFPTDKSWHIHALRHSLAYNFLKEGGQMYQLQAILGHKHIGTTVDLYGQISVQDVKNPSPYPF